MQFLRRMSGCREEQSALDPTPARSVAALFIPDSRSSSTLLTVFEGTRKAWPSLRAVSTRARPGAVFGSKLHPVGRIAGRQPSNAVLAMEYAVNHGTPRVTFGANP